MVLILGTHFGRDKNGSVSHTLCMLHKLFDAKTGQIFVGSPMTKLTDKTEQRWLAEAPEIKATLHKIGFKLFVHSPYTLNFAKDAKEENAYWIHALKRELKIADAMGAEGCVLHMGKAVKLDQAAAERNFHANLVTILDFIRQEKLGVKLFVETSAGQGSELYPTLGSLDPLARFYNAFTTLQKETLKLCVDTCHIFAAGVDLNTPESVQRFWKEWEEKIGVAHLGVIHINNSAKALFSRVDRHANILDGQIAQEGLAAFVKAAKKHNIPMILETPNCQFDIPNVHRLLGSHKKDVSLQEWQHALFQGSFT